MQPVGSYLINFFRVNFTQPKNFDLNLKLKFSSRVKFTPKKFHEIDSITYIIE